MARPRLNGSEERLTAFIGANVTPSQRAAFDAACAAAGLSPAEFVRTRCLSLQDNSPPPRRHDRPDATALLAEFGRVGNNLNQLARRANQSDRFPEEALLRSVIADLKAAIDRIV